MHVNIIRTISGAIVTFRFLIYGVLILLKSSYAEVHDTNVKIYVKTKDH